MGATYQSIVGNPPLFYQYAWKKWYDTLLAAREIYCQGNRPITYYFAVGGSDSNNGTNPTTPFQTLTKAQSIIDGSNGGITLLFNRGDEFVSSSGIDITKTNVKVADYGDLNAAKPMFSAFTNIWASGSNRWSQINSNLYSGLLPNAGWVRQKGNDDLRLNPLIYGFGGPYTSGTPFSWFKGGSFVYINYSGLNPNNYDFEWAMDVQDDGIEVRADGAWVKNIRCDGWGVTALQQYQNYGIRCTPTGTDTVLVDSCEAYYQGRHGISQHSQGVAASGGIVVVIDCLNGLPNNTTGAGVNLYNAFQSQGGQETIFHNCTCTHGSLPQSGVVATNDQTDSFFGHTTGGYANLAIVFNGKNLRATGRNNTAAGSALFSNLPPGSGENPSTIRAFINFHRDHIVTSNYGGAKSAYLNCSFNLNFPLGDVSAQQNSTQGVDSHYLNCIWNIQDAQNGYSPRYLWFSVPTNNKFRLQNCYIFNSGLNIAFTALSGGSGSYVSNSIFVKQGAGTFEPTFLNASNITYTATTGVLQVGTTSMSGAIGQILMVGKPPLYSIPPLPNYISLLASGSTTNLYPLEYDYFWNKRDPSYNTIGPVQASFTPSTQKVVASSAIKNGGAIVGLPGLGRRQRLEDNLPSNETNQAIGNRFDNPRYYGPG